MGNFEVRFWHHPPWLSSEETCPRRSVRTVQEKTLLKHFPCSSPATLLHPVNYVTIVPWSGIITRCPTCARWNLYSSGSPSLQVFFLLAGLLSVRYAPVSEGTKACKEANALFASEWIFINWKIDRLSFQASHELGHVGPHKPQRIRKHCLGSWVLEFPLWITIQHRFFRVGDGDGSGWTSNPSVIPKWKLASLCKTYRRLLFLLLLRQTHHQGPLQKSPQFAPSWFRF